MGNPLVEPTRRALLGGLVVSFSFAPCANAQSENADKAAGPKPRAPTLPGSLKRNAWLDAWIHIGEDGHATIFTGKVDLGQGITTALTQVAAEELNLPFARISIVTADTARSPDEGITAGSHSMQDSGTAIANAAANVHLLLVRAAAQKWQLNPDELTTSGSGEVLAADGRTLSYGALATALSLHVQAAPDVRRRNPAQYNVLGRDVPRLDIPAKLTGGQAYIQDLRLPNMLHARVVRGPSCGTRLDKIDIEAAVRSPGVAKVVANGQFLAVAAETEWQALGALRILQTAAWTRVAPPIPKTSIPQTLKALSSQTVTVLDTSDSTRPSARTVSARYTRPWLSHGSIGPSCAVALFQDGRLTIWSHSQGIFDLRRATAELVGLSPDLVHCIHMPGAGCYGHNGADDVAADAALVAMAVPGRPIRLQWMREQEFGWEPLGSAMVSDLEASVDAGGTITSWIHDVWSNPHNTRPSRAGGFLAGREIVPAFAAPPVKPLPMPEGDGHRNSNPLYALPNMHVAYHFAPDAPLRTSALRSLGAHHNIFSIESMMDELAHAAGIDPLAFRLAHMKDERARATMEAAAKGIDWTPRRPSNGRIGTGLAFARYKNLGAYCTIAMLVEVVRETGIIRVRRVYAAVDAGQAATPDGVRNQIEGGIIQSLSWTMRESVLFDETHRLSFDWSGYPISRFSDVPEDIDVEVLARPGLPFLGAGEAAQGPAAAALANAVADAIGVRLRDLPLDPDRVRAAITSN